MHVSEQAYVILAALVVLFVIVLSDNVPNSVREAARPDIAVTGGASSRENSPESREERLIAPKRSDTEPQQSPESAASAQMPTDPPAASPAPPTPPEEVFGEDSPLRTYGNAAAAAINRYTAEVHRDAAALNDFFTEQDTFAAAEVRAVASKYGKLGSELAAIVPPADMQGLHAALAEAYKQAADSLGALSASSDQEALRESARAYTEGVSATNRGIVDIALFFEEQGIRFASTEPGSLFTLPR